MNKFILSILVLFLSLNINAEEQYKVTLKVEKKSGVINKFFITTGAHGRFHEGSKSGYLAVKCNQNQNGMNKSTSIQRIFAGVKFENVIIKNVLQLKISEYIVNQKDGDIEKLNASDCLTITPDVTTYIDKIQHPTTSEVAKQYKLKNDKILTLKVIKI